MSSTASKPIRITYGATVPLPPDEAYGFVSDPLNWPTFFRRCESTRSDDWGAGSRGQMSNVVLGRTITSQIEVTVWNPPHEFRYFTRQPGTPPLDNRRIFEAVPGGTRLNGTTTVTPRAGLAGLLDRARVRALRRIVAAAMVRLPEAARAAEQPPTE